jgi:hypothetical protein
LHSLVFGDGQSMKNSSIRRNYLFGAFGGLTVVLLSASYSPAFAAGTGPFTDPNGNHCNSPDPATGLCDVSGPAAPFGLPGETVKQMFDRMQKEQEREHNIQTMINGMLATQFGMGFQPDTPSIFGPFGDKPGYLGMHVSNGGTSGDVTLGGGGYSLRNGGVSISDTAGFIAPGTQSASYHENGGGGGISGMYDASRFVGANQHLLFSGAFDYTSSNTNFGGVGAGSTINSDNYTFTGIALYSNYNTYLALSASYQFGNNSEFNSSDGSTGSYRSDGYDIDARLGHIFWLFNTMLQPTASRMSVKALPKPSEGYAIGLDLSGHLGYSSDVAKGFTDSSGFVFGDERVQGGETGLQARLFATIQKYGVIWQPYVSGTVDWRFNYSHVSNFPGQLTLATGDAVTFADATTFAGATLGLDVKTSYGWIVGVNGFYDRSSDTEIVGGKAYVVSAKLRPFRPCSSTA